MTIRNCVTAPIRFYRKYLSPRKKGACCKYWPSCSAYAIEAIEKRGVCMGTALSLWRILRCNPFSRGGIDCVPTRGFTDKTKSPALPYVPKEKPNMEK